MADRTCSVDECERKVSCRGWCTMHYARWYKHGSTELRPPRRCSVKGCERRHESHGFCELHCRRWQRTGDPLCDGRPSTLDRFVAKVERTEDCWLWTGASTALGYGQFSGGQGRLVYAHRWSYEHHVGPIPEGLVIDHLCQTPSCVNPEHLEPVTQAENVRRTYLRGAREKAAT